MKKNSKSEEKAVDTFSNSYIDTCSANDCTGLIPALPQNEAEIESYEELYNFLPGMKDAAKDTK